VEKPGHYDAALGVWANAGVYILEPPVLREIPPGVPYDFGHDLFPRLLAQGHPLYAATVCTYFLAIDTPERYAAAQAFFAQR
jgi:NDP-sugar pyrophosphorylase family protein